MTMFGRRNLLLVSASLAAFAAAGYQPAAAQQLTIGLSIITLGDQWMVRLANGAKEAGKRLGVDVVVQNPDGASKAQVDGIESAIAQKMNAIIVDAIDPNGVQPVFAAARSAGIPVVAVDEVLANFENVTASVGLDNYEVGRAIGLKVLEYAKANGLEQVVVGVLQTLDAPIENTRFAGFESVVNENPKLMRIAQRIDCKFSTNEAFKGSENVIVANPDLNFFFSNGAAYSVGALAAIRTQGAQERIKIAGIDFTKELITAFRNGTYVIAAETDPEAMGARAVEVAVSLAKGEKVSKAEHTKYYFRTEAELPEVEARLGNGG